MATWEFKISLEERREEGREEEGKEKIKEGRKEEERDRDRQRDRQTQRTFFSWQSISFHPSSKRLCKSGLYFPALLLLFTERETEARNFGVACFSGWQRQMEPDLYSQPCNGQLAWS